MNMIFAIAIGGALGSVLRYAVGLLSSNLVVFSGFPWGTMVINVAGSFFMGAFVSYFMITNTASQEMRAFLTIGLLGGFTTFSTFSLDAITLWEQGAGAQALAYVLGSVILSICAIALGMFIVKGFVS